MLKRRLLPKTQQDAYHSDVPGVSWNKKYKRWQVDIKINGHRLYKNFIPKRNKPTDDVFARRLAEKQRNDWEQEYQLSRGGATKDLKRRAQQDRRRRAATASLKKSAKNSSTRRR